MKLYWSSRSPYVRKVMVVAHEVGLAQDIERERVVVSAYLPNTEMLPQNPLGKIPTLLLDDGSAVYDSRVICEYLDSRHDGTPLFPPAGPERLRALTWLALGDGVVDMLIQRLYEERVRDAALRSDKLLTSLMGKLDASLASMNAQAGELAAAPFGIGQIAIGCALSYMDFRFADDGWRDGRAELADWHAEFSLRPSAVATAHVDA
tara:strand:+ start:365 stop:982 length:618 start_codon:yes stop_codon:yes gene_type:complete